MKPFAPEIENMLETLEARIAPASVGSGADYSGVPIYVSEGTGLFPANFGAPEIVSASEMRFKDADGDGITIKFDRDVLTPEALANAFHFEEGEHGSKLVGIDIAKLAGDAKSLRGLDISVTSTAPSADFEFGKHFEPAQVLINGEWVTLESSGGNGKAEIGFINGAGIDLGDVNIAGNLGKIIAGDSKPGTAGLESLTVESLGALGEAGPLDATVLASTITGSLKKLSVTHDINGALLYLQGGKKADLLDAYVGGNLVGGGFKYSGGIYAEGTIKSLSILGDVVGGSAERSGFIHGDDGIKKLVVGGDLEGGSAYGAGRIEGSGIGSVEVKGDVHAGSDQYAGSIYSTGSIKTLEVGGSLLGGEKRGSGSIFADKKIGSAVLNGGLAGGPGEASGYLQAQKSISKLTVDGDLVGGAGLRSGSVATFDGKIGKIDHDGDAIAGTGIASGKVIDFANKGVKKSHSSGSSSSSSGTLTLGSWTTVGLGGYGGTGSTSGAVLGTVGGSGTATITAGTFSLLPGFTDTLVSGGFPGTFNIAGPNITIEFSLPDTGASQALSVFLDKLNFTNGVTSLTFVVKEGSETISLADLVANYGFTWPEDLLVTAKDGGGLLVSPRPPAA